MTRIEISAAAHAALAAPATRGLVEPQRSPEGGYFIWLAPKGTDLSAHSAETLAAVAATLKARPRKTLGWKTPAEALDLMAGREPNIRVATTV